MLAGGVGGMLIGVFIGWLIDVMTVEDTVREKVSSESRFKDAFKAIIQSKTTRKVKVGIFEENDSHLGDIELESDKGVSSDVRVGHVFYLTN